MSERHRHARPILNGPFVPVTTEPEAQAEPQAAAEPERAPADTAAVGQYMFVRKPSTPRRAGRRAPR
ncbi:MAG: hypothetical protein AAGA54_01050 [Myxococcota bacterium]